MLFLNKLCTKTQNIITLYGYFCIFFSHLIKFHIAQPVSNNNAFNWARKNSYLTWS